MSVAGGPHEHTVRFVSEGATLHEARVGADCSLPRVGERVIVRDRVQRVTDVLWLLPFDVVEIRLGP